MPPVTCHQLQNIWITWESERHFHCYSGHLTAKVKDKGEKSVKWDLGSESERGGWPFWTLYFIPRGIKLAMVDDGYLACMFYAAVWGKLQPQLFILELLQENHERLLVDTGLPLARHQQDPHHLLLHSSDQLCSPHGACGRQGGFALKTFVLIRRFTVPSYSKRCHWQNKERGRRLRVFSSRRQVVKLNIFHLRGFLYTSI